MIAGFEGDCLPKVGVDLVAHIHHRLLHLSEGIVEFDDAAAAALPSAGPQDAWLRLAALGGRLCCLC